MKNDVEIPAWVTSVSQAAEQDPWLRLMVLNPVNGEVSIFVNRIIDMDAQEPPPPPTYPYPIMPAHGPP